MGPDFTVGAVAARATIEANHLARRQKAWCEDFACYDMLMARAFLLHGHVGNSR